MSLNSKKSTMARKSKEQMRLVSCMTCRFSKILSYGPDDPLIAKCLKRFDTFFNDYVREVAKMKRICPLWVISTGKKEVINIR